VTVASAIKCFDKDVTRRRWGAGSYDADGYYQEPSYSDSTIRASVQPLRGNELLRLPEGQRQLKNIKLCTPSDLRVVDDNTKTKADQIIDGSTTYEITTAEDWTDEGGYWKGEAVEIGP